MSRARLDHVAKTLNAARVWYSGPFIEAIQWGLDGGGGPAAAGT